MLDFALKKSINPTDLILLIDHVLIKNIEDSKVIAKYGMREEFPEELNDFIKKIAKIDGGYK